MKLTKRQLYNLINETLNINEDRVPRARKLIRKIEDADARVDKLIAMLDEGEDSHSKAELEEYREELNQYLDKLKIALDREFGIKPRQRRKVANVKNKVEDFLKGKTVKNKIKSKKSDKEPESPKKEPIPSDDKTSSNKSNEPDMISQDNDNSSEREDDEPNKGSETLAQEPAGESTNWADSRAGGAERATVDVINYIKELSKKYPSVYEEKKQGRGHANVYLGKALAKDGVPGLDTVFVFTLDEFKQLNPGKTFEDFIQDGTKGSSLATFEGFDDESLNIPLVHQKLNKGGLFSGNVYYDETSYKLLLDSPAGDYILVGVFLTDDGKHLYYDRNKYDKLKGNVNEQKLVYGKSYATLLRERYRGRRQ